MYFLDFVEASLSYIGWWVALIGSVLFKRCKLRPWLERHYKTTYIRRLQIRKRRLRDILNDPVLVLDLERSMEKQYKGNRKRVLEAIERLRQNAQADVPTDGEDDDGEDHDANTKGDSKKQAAKTIFYGTIAIGVSLHSILNIFGLDMDSTWIIECVLFFLVHLVDNVHNKKKQFQFARESVTSFSSGGGHLELQLPLLTEEQEAAA